MLSPITTSEFKDVNAAVKVLPDVLISLNCFVVCRWIFFEQPGMNQS